MPTYEYECGACGHRFELFQSITAKPIKKCPACQRAKAKRLISAGASIIFKGGGFYQTDYRSESYKKAAKAEKEAASGGGKKESASGGSSSSASTGSNGSASSGGGGGDKKK